MLVAITKIFIFLCVLIVPLRGPSRRREDKNSLPESAMVYSKYGINEYGDLELMDKDQKH
ncbi:hypothetical protein [Mucilaginibacter sp. SP1R1]|uniref:hypothetical protein n=1 Tax=Mucilaginibacter sp. SP1R1 TaxID=2723091 RepID=UPI00160B13D9|nr:hypothetical protein [Mucilaginibacter sp. SP1R1]MBB6148951.1 hypothetical protein [Mucilaginibacter sp. SP1R1]